MNTEKEIIYNILNTIRDAEHNEDERITERLMRSYLRTYRADSIRKHYKNGHTVEDEVFQLIPVSLNKIGSTNEFRLDSLPKVIRMENHSGFYLEKNGISIPIVSSENYELSKRNSFGNYLVQSKTEGARLTLFGGNFINCMDSTRNNSLLIEYIMKEIQIKSQIRPPVQITLDVDFFAVLNNPDDCPGYDWEVDTFPFPAERLSELKGEILRKEFGIMVQAKRDEVSNSRNDSIRYHDNEDVSNQG